MYRGLMAFVSIVFFIGSCFSQDKLGSSANYAEIRKQFIETYKEVIVQDTSLQIDDQKYDVSLKYRCLFDSAVVIPPKFIWEGARKRFVTHNFASDIIVRKNGVIIYEKTITKKKFKKILYDRENRYGVVVASNFHRYDEAQKVFIFTFSISIPVTDLGEGVVLLVDSEGRDTVKLSP